jgi:hypothetical protein
MKKLLFYLSILPFFYSCNTNVRNSNLKKSEILNIKIHRFDSSFIMLDTTNLRISINKLHSQFPDFYKVFFNEILSFESVDTLGIQKGIQHFLNDIDTY